MTRRRSAVGRLLHEADRWLSHWLSLVEEKDVAAPPAHMAGMYRQMVEHLLSLSSQLAATGSGDAASDQQGLPPESGSC